MDITLPYTDAAKEAVCGNTTYGKQKITWAQWQELLVLSGYKRIVEVPKKHVGFRPTQDEIEFLYQRLGNFFIQNQKSSVKI